MLLAPASEVWGRRPVYLVSWFLFCLCQIPVSPNRIQSSNLKSSKLTTSVVSRSPSHTTFRWWPPLGSFPDSWDRKSLHPTRTLHVPMLTSCSHSAPLSNEAGTITDLIPTAKSGYAIALYALASVIGPALGSVMGGYPVEKLGWRWLYWIYAIVFGAHIMIIWAFMPETRENIGRSQIPPTLLVANSDQVNPFEQFSRPRSATSARVTRT